MMLSRRKLFQAIVATPIAAMLARHAQSNNAPQKAVCAHSKSPALFQSGYTLEVPSADLSFPGANRQEILERVTAQCADRIYGDLLYRYKDLSKLAFLALDVPGGVEHIHSGPMGKLPCVRSIRMFDGFRDVWIVRVDALVRA